MSHFSTIKTKIKDKEHLVEALKDLGYPAHVENVVMVVEDPAHAKDHPTIEVEVSAGTEIGFRYNPVTESYELVTDLQTWQHNIPVERFITKLTQQYALRVLTTAVKEEGFVIQDQVVNENDLAVELVCTRWE